MEAKEKFEQLFNYSVERRKAAWNQAARGYYLTHHQVYSDSDYLNGLVAGAYWCDVISDEDFKTYTDDLADMLEEGMNMIEEMQNVMRGTK